MCTTAGSTTVHSGVRVRLPWQIPKLYQYGLDLLLLLLAVLELGEVRRFEPFELLFLRPLQEQPILTVHRSLQSLLSFWFLL